MKRARETGFTLVELLVVLSIIGLLAGLLVGAASRARVKARVVRAEAEVRELAKAWKAYWLTYERWPAGYESSSNLPMDSAAMDILMGNNDGENPQGIRFMDADLDESGNFDDPWGTPYRMNFRPVESITEEEYYETTVFLPNRQRYAYEVD